MLKTKKSYLLFFLLLISTLFSACNSTVETTTPVVTSAATTQVQTFTTSSTTVAVLPTPVPVVAPVTTAASSGLLSEQRQLLTQLAGLPVFVYVPSGLPLNRPAQALLILHGMNGNGVAISKDFLEYADQYKWIVLAPTLPYNPDYTNPKVLQQEDPTLLVSLNKMVDEAPNLLGLPFNSHLLVYGFSRGAQLAHRYALFYPERILGVSAASAGSYTMPFSSYADLSTVTPNTPEASKPVLFPYGVSDINKFTGRTFDKTALRKVNFWLEVGAQDDKNNEVSRAFDVFQGPNRVERARSFYAALRQNGVTATLTLYPNTGHSISPEMRKQACKFFRSVTEIDQKNAPDQKTA